MTSADSAATAAGSSDPPSRLIGREAELESLRATLIAAQRAAEPCIVTLLGPAGIGKSRFLTELVAELSRDPNDAPRVYRASVTSSAQGFGVFARLLRARFAIREGSSEEASIVQLRGQVMSVLEDRRVDDVCFFLGQMMGLRMPESALTRAVGQDSAQGEHLRRSVIKRFLEADAALGPLVLVFEDLHAADQESLALLSYLCHELRAAITVLCSARPELASRHPGLIESSPSRHRVIQLAPLSQEQAASVMRLLLQPCTGGVPERLVDAAIASAGGNPGMLEQMVRLYLDAGVLEEAGVLGPESWRVNLERLASVRLPETTEDAVAARVEALSERERRILEYAAAMGSVFWLGAVVALVRQDQPVPEFWQPREQLDREAVRAALDGLVERGHLLKLPDSTFLGELEYVFKQSQQREQLAASISREVSRQYHQTLAGWLAQKEAVHSQEDHCLMLAEQLEKADNRTGAAHALLGAADLARAHMGALRAEAHYQKGLDLLGETDARRRIDALHNRGDVLAVLGRRDEAASCFREMLGLAFRFGLLSKGGAAHNRIGRIGRDGGALKEAQQHFATALELFQAAEDQRGIAACQDDLGQLAWMRGEHEEALRQTQVGLDLRTQLGDRRSIALSLSHLGRIMLDHGQPEKAREALQGALRLRREIDDPIGTVDSLSDLARLARDQGQHAQSLAHLREAQAIAAEIGDPYRAARVGAALGSAHARLAEVEPALQLLKQAESAAEQLDDKLILAEARRGLAKVYLGQGELRPAREAIKSAVDLLGTIKSKRHLAPAIRTLGQVTAAGAWGKEHQVKAVEYFMRSITLSKELNNELEIAKSYRAFAEYVLASEQYRDDADIQREALKVNAVADEIFARRRRALGSG